MLGVLVADKPMPRAEVKAICPTADAFRSTIKALKDAGYIREVLEPTAKGRAAFRKFQAEAPDRITRPPSARAKRAARVCPPHRPMKFHMCSPFAQADEIRRKAEAAQRMADEAIGQPTPTKGAHAD